MKYAVEAAHGYAVSSGEGHSSTRLFGNIYFDEMGDSVMKVEELVFFPTQLVHVETIRFNAEKKLEKIMVTILRKKKLVFFNSQKKLQMKSRQCNLWKFRVSVYCGRTLEKICIQYHQKCCHTQ